MINTNTESSGYLGAAGTYKTQGSNSFCPCCGYCSHCGRGGNYQYPYWFEYPLSPNYTFYPNTNQQESKTAKDKYCSNNLKDHML